MYCRRVSFIVLSAFSGTALNPHWYRLWHLGGAVGIVLIMIIGAVAFKQTPDLPAVIGIVLIIAGIVVINFFSKMQVH